MPQFLAQFREPGRRLHPMQSGMLGSERPSHRLHRPGTRRQPVEQIDAVDAIEDDARATVHGDPLVDARHVRTRTVRCPQCDHLALDHPAVGRVPGEPEHASVIPCEDLGLAPGSEQLQVTGRHRVRS